VLVDWVDVRGEGGGSLSRREEGHRKAGNWSRGERSLGEEEGGAVYGVDDQWETSLGEGEEGARRRDDWVVHREAENVRAVLFSLLRLVCA
jgi:hypothetical protein